MERYFSRHIDYALRDWAAAKSRKPLGAEAHQSFIKYIYLDSGLLLRILSLDTGQAANLTQQILVGEAGDLVNKGSLTEMVAGLELLRYQTPFQRHDLYFWMRTEKNSMAEVDYLLVKNAEILPIEIKSGVQGGMKSLFQFLDTKAASTGIRSSLENFGTYNYKDKRIDLYPLYALSNINA